MERKEKRKVEVKAILEALYFQRFFRPVIRSAVVIVFKVFLFKKNISIIFFYFLKIIFKINTSK